jgi:MoxR-like ATPase
MTDSIKAPAIYEEFAVYDPSARDRSASEPVALLPPPPWRRFRGVPPVTARIIEDEQRETEYEYVCSPDVARVVNVALLLRRPLLITGNPGTGKSSLAYHVARKLGYGRVLRWNITSRSTLKEGLYSYDSLQRLNDSSLPDESGTHRKAAPLENYIKLGPLGTALLPAVQPRVLLIDELDKSDIDLPNDLLHAFEDGEYEIPEVKRALKSNETLNVFAADGEDPVPIGGKVVCSEFPFVVITSNAEREFPPAFRRRCIRVELLEPQDDDAKRKKLRDVAKSHLEELFRGRDGLMESVLDDFLTQQKDGFVANDQLLGALYLVGGVNPGPEDADHKGATRHIIAPLTRSGQIS